MGDIINRRLREISDEDIKKIFDIYISWQKEENYEDIKGFCKVANMDEIKDNDYILTSDRYMGIEDDGEPYKSSGGDMVESELVMIPKGWEVKKYKN